MTEPSLSERPVYVISVAAELAGMHPQTLRAYDRLGLVVPGRAGRARRYSERDVALLREVGRLSAEEGVGLAGIRRILDLRREVAALRDRLEELGSELARTQASARAETAAALDAHMLSTRRDLVPLRAQPGTSVVLYRQRRR
jgi:MerR family transcriptional regulator/heat shock protein HspR